MSKSPLQAAWLGSVPYEQAWGLQRAVAREVKAGSRPDTVLFLEHPHVFTMGRKGVAEHLLWDEKTRAERTVDVVWSDRGGDATYHGPGQLVGYPLLDLGRHGGDILLYLRNLEFAIIDYLGTFGLDAAPGGPGLTGVWCQDAKIAAIGVKLGHGITSHGFALNLTADLDYFTGIVPCGLSDRTVTSLELLTGRAVPVGEAARSIAPILAERLSGTIEWIDALTLPEPMAEPLKVAPELPLLR